MSLLTIVIVTVVWVLLICLIYVYAQMDITAKRIICIGMAVVLVLWLIYAVDLIDKMQGVKM